MRLAVVLQRGWLSPGLKDNMELGFSKRWLIAEDALRDSQGHWAEYVQAFRRGLENMGHSVEILCDSHAEKWLVDELGAKPVLPDSIWHRMGDGAGKLKRFARIPVHAWQTYRAMRKRMRRGPPADVIFVPTVMLPHLLGWWCLMRGLRREIKGTVIFYFLSTPVAIDPVSGRGRLSSKPMAKLFGAMIRRLASLDRVDGKVVFGAETGVLCKALCEATGVPFTYLPQPVSTFAEPATKGRPLTMAVYGAARHEKGSDILQEAIALHLERRPDSATRFVIQWREDFHDDQGRVVRKNAVLLKDSRIEYVDAYIKQGEYARRMAATDVMLLPYRKGSYGLRGSRVVIEAMVHGIPVIATADTPLAEQAGMYGACIPCTDGQVESLADAIARMEDFHADFKALAEQRAPLAADHFSVARFNQLLCESVSFS